ncbi:MAG: helix-turn-helix transcriptional regulator [Oscillospiraceae bacterium]|nr:helix-turn-helix transcriptional regulator [Oscillospiraceae bacterium]
MYMKLSENIRSHRKERGLTQEQLAEVLGVTTGAVYKWEAGLSNPELGMLMDIADFFDTSVDTLLGYEMKDNGLQSTIDRLYGFINDRDKTGIPEAEKAMKRYPNNFETVYASANLFFMLGTDNKDKKLLTRSIGLFQRSLTLISQNRYAKRNESTIYGNIAMIYFVLEDYEKAADIMKENDIAGIYDTFIGFSLLKCGKPDEAERYLTDSFFTGISTLINFIYGNTLLNIRREEYTNAEETLLWGTQLLHGLRVSPGYYDRLLSHLDTLLAYVRLRQGRRKEASDLLISAADMARRFDSDPSYTADTSRFGSAAAKAQQFDIMGKTALESIDFIRKELDSREFDKLWKEVRDCE